jgi:cation diffusion facilitator family transporter
VSRPEARNKTAEEHVHQPHDHHHGEGKHHEHWHDHAHGKLQSLNLLHAHAHEPVDPDLAESKQGVRVLLISLAILAATSAAQAVVVWLTGSVALLADTIHNVGDALTAVPLALAFVLARRPPSARFNFGLGRSEDLAGLGIVVLIAFSGIVAMVESISRLVYPEPPTHLLAGILAGLLGFIGNEAVAEYRIRQGRRMHSAALIADGQHARIDGYTSLSVAIGLGLVWMGVGIADPVVGLFISLVIARITWDTARSVGLRLLDGIEPRYLQPIREVAQSCVPAGALKDVRGRWFGHVIFVEVEVDAALIEPARLITLGHDLQHALHAAGTRARRVAVVVS